MNFCCVGLLFVASAALVSTPAVASTPRVLQIVMLEIGADELDLEYSTLNVRHVEDEGPSSAESRLFPIIHGPSYFSALLHYHHQSLWEHHRLQGTGFGIHWDSRSR
jgi:hypothetical protein